MIAVLDYNREYAQAVAGRLNDAGFEATASMNEAVLCKSHQIIFPPVQDVSCILRKFHLLNLYSLLRMVNKPVLGIASGIELMLEFAMERKESALCYFPELSERFGIHKIEIPEGEYPVSIANPCPLTEGIKDGDLFHFSYALTWEGKTEIMKALFSVGSDEYPCICRKGENYSVMFDVLASGENGDTILKNFALMEHKPLENDCPA